MDGRSMVELGKWDAVAGLRVHDEVAVPAERERDSVVFD